MDSMISRLDIVEKAREVLKKHCVTEAPVKIREICAAEDISVDITDMSELEKNANRKISGLIYVERDPITKKISTKQIMVNEDDISARRNFTMAHELGHYFLHIPTDDDGVIISFRGARSPREREADIFAAELLMPANLVKQAYKSVPFPTASYLAQRFKVSKPAMAYRLDELGLSYIG